MHEDLSLIHGTHIKSRPGVVLEILVPEKQGQKNPVGQLTWPDGLALAPSATLPQRQVDAPETLMLKLPSGSHT